MIAFEQLQRHYQLNPRFIAYLGFSYYKESMYEEATEYLEKSIPQLTAYSPHEQAVYLYACAESHFNLSHYQQALPYYQQALPLTTGLDAADINYHRHSATIWTKRSSLTLSSLTPLPLTQLILML